MDALGRNVVFWLLLFGFMFQTLAYDFSIKCHPPRVVAEVASDATLSCRVLPSNNLTYDFVQLSLLKEPKKVFVWRKGEAHLTDQHEDYKDRVQIQKEDLKDGKAVFTISNVGLKDAGTYRCLVNVGSEKEVGDVELKVRSGEKEKRNDPTNDAVNCGPLGIALMVPIVVFLWKKCFPHRNGGGERRDL